MTDAEGDMCRGTRNVSEYVVTVDDATGMTMKIDRKDDRTGKHRELTPFEYWALFGCYVPFCAGCRP